MRADDTCSYDDALKKHNFSVFLKAFPWKEDLERYLSLRTTYFPLLLKIIHENIIKDADDDDDDNLEKARNILKLAISLLNENAELRDDMAGLDQYLHLSTATGNSDVASTGIQAGWSTILQRAAEAETSHLKPSPRSASQWNQQEQALFMSHRSKYIAEVRKLCKDELPEFVQTNVPKDALARKVAESQIAKRKATEAATMQKLEADLTQLSTIIGNDIKSLNRESIVEEDTKDTGGVPDDRMAALHGTTFRPLDACVSTACAASGCSLATQTEIVDACQILTTHIQRKADIGRDMLLINTVTDKGFKGLAALNASPDAEAKPLRLFLRGTVTPSCGPMALTSTVVLPDVAQLTVNGVNVALSLCMTKDQASASAWSGSRFCPAMLAKIPKEPKGKGKGKQNALRPRGVAVESGEAPPQPTSDPKSVTLKLDKEDDSVTICSSSPPVTLTVYSLAGEVPFGGHECTAADILTVCGPSLKRERNAGSDDPATAKRLRASTLLGR